MDTKDLNAFLKVYESGSINAAARECFMSPQGLSKLIQNLERELGTELFFRTAQGVVPTRCGDYLYRNSHVMLSFFEQVRASIREGCRELYRPLNVASVTGMLRYLTIDFLLDFQSRFPNIPLCVLEMSDDEVDRQLQSGEAEVGFMAGPVDPTRYQAQFFTSHRHCLVLHESHPLAAKAAIDYMDLDGQPIALIGRSCHPYHNNVNRFRRAGSRPIIRMEVSEIDLTHQVASMNRGIGLSVDFPAWEHRYPGTVIRPFSDPACTWDTYFIYKKGAILSPEAAAFHEFAFSWLKEHQPQLFQWPEDDPGAHIAVPVPPR